MAKKLSPEELEAQIEALTAENTDLKGQVETLNAVIGSAQAGTVIEEVKEVKLETPAKAFKHGDKKYKWALASFYLPGEGRVVAATATNEQIDALLAMEGQGILVEQA